MRRRFFFCLLILLSAFAVPVYGDSTIRDIDIVVDLYYDGSARITERWDVAATSGTEWYLVKGNLGDIVISNLSVTDETGRKFINEGKWDIDRSISEKAGILILKNMTNPPIYRSLFRAKNLTVRGKA